MKKFLFTLLLSLGVLGVMSTTAAAKCNGEDSTPKVEKAAKCETGKCSTGKCDMGKSEESTEEKDEPKKEEANSEGKCGTGKCSS